MNKLLMLFLFAIVATTTVQDFKELEDLVLEFEIPDWLINGWNKIKEYLNKAIDWLKENGLYEPLIETIKKYGKAAAIKICTNWTTEEICEQIVERIMRLFD